ncbi:MAG: Holliday junction resolvase RuvX [Planctomycetota bacterium]
MRRLAIDPGGKRTGLALGDDHSRIASPLGAINGVGSGAFAHQLDKQIDLAGPDALLVGWPVDMNGRRGPSAKASEALALQLARTTGLPVLLVDERLTTDQANSAMAQSGLTHQQKKARRDGLAAVALLGRFWEAGCQGVDPANLPDKAEPAGDQNTKA